MLFNSIEFAIFLPVVFIFYWLIFKDSLKWQNVFIMIVSYVFYGWWDYRFLSLIAFSSVLDFIIGIALKNNNIKQQRKALLILSLTVNLGLLAYFKYVNFFITSFYEAFTFLGQPFSKGTLSIILPVGISFYTFQTLSYSIDVYKKKLEPTTNAIAFFSYVAFFPQLVAGPIERASCLLPQFFRKREFNYERAMDGARQILWGLFKKIVIADGAAVYVNKIFDHYEQLPGSALLIGAILFSFQIYGDFSGYSDIAIGTARIFGFNLMQNFAFPYFSRDIAEFWRRWHISLSTWFRDYVYLPLGGSRCNLLRNIRNVFIIFIVSGFWHGANWTFIVWGTLNALLFIPLLLVKHNRKHLAIVGQGKIFPSVKEMLKVGLTFFIVCLTWIVFRAENMNQALGFITHLFSPSLLDVLSGFYSITIDIQRLMLIFIYIGILIIIEWNAREKQHGLEINNSQSLSLIKKICNISLYIVLAILIIINIPNEARGFIYFQF